jgi:hypothetical protein
MGRKLVPIRPWIGMQLYLALGDSQKLEDCVATVNYEEVSRKRRNTLYEEKTGPGILFITADPTGYSRDPRLKGKCDCLASSRNMMTPLHRAEDSNPRVSDSDCYPLLLLIILGADKCTTRRASMLQGVSNEFAEYVLDRNPQQP